MLAIDDYLAALEADQRAELARIRRIVRETAPEAEEVVSYGMPGFKYRGKYLVGYYAFKDHLSLFPTAQPIEELKEKLQDYKLSKGTIQFSPASTIPESVIVELIQVRLRSITQ